MRHGGARSGMTGLGKAVCGGWEQMTASEFKKIREGLGLSQSDLATALGLGPNGSRTVQRIEAGANITGPMALAMEKLRDECRQDKAI